MSPRVVARFASAAAVVTMIATNAVGYIHFPPMTLAKMCQISHHIRLLKVEKFDKDKRVVVFGCEKILKDGKSKIASFKLLVRPKATGTKPILDWLKEGKRAVMFSIEGQAGKDMRGIMRGLAYVFIDDYCFSADYNADGKFWLLLRGEPELSACYHGSVERLREAVKDTLAGKKVKVPVKEPNAKMDHDKRRNEINDALKSNLGSHGGPR